jgi:hypothetical protein
MFTDPTGTHGLASGLFEFDVPILNLAGFLFIFVFNRRDCKDHSVGQVANQEELDRIIQEHLDIYGGYVTYSFLNPTTAGPTGSFHHCVAIEWTFLVGIGILATGHVIHQRRQRRMRTEANFNGVDSFFAKLAND